MLVEYIRNIPLFKHLKDSQLKEIASRCRDASVKKGDVVFYKTTPSTDLYIVLSGRLKATLADEEGDEIMLSSFKAGDFFGELSLIDGRGRSATIAAEEDSDLAVLKRDLFLDLLIKDSKMAVELMATLVSRLRKADGMIESLAFLEVSERLAKTLRDMASAEGKELDGRLKIKKLTHKELAGIIGASREAVTKCMKLLASKGIIEPGNHNTYQKFPDGNVTNSAQKDSHTRGRNHYGQAGAAQNRS